MESFINFICLYAHEAYWILFILLLLAGLNVPFSEDIIILVAGMIGSTCIPEHWLQLYFFVLMGAYFSAWEAYWIGRLLGPKLYSIRWFAHVITPHRIERINHYYEKFGLFTFIVGRFCPGGVRNCLFMTAGLGKMPFNKFILRDGIACFISVTTLYSIGFKFGQHRDILLAHFYTYQHIVISTIGVLIVCGVTYFWIKNRKKSSDLT